MFENKYQVTLQNPQAGLTPSLSLESVAKPKHINSIEVWDKAFRIFVGVFTQKYPLEAPHLMKYREIIHDLAVRGQNWQFYDENFRFLRNLNVSSYSWGHVNWELRLRSQSYQGKQRPTHQSFVQISLVQDHIFIFRKVFAINSTKVFPVPVVLSSTFALSVMGITGLPTAIFVPPVIEDQQNLFPLLPSLPTPIQIDRFLALLDGYTPSTVQYLKEGLLQVFILIIQDLKFQSIQKTYYLR